MNNSFEWQSATAESQGMKSSKMAEQWKLLKKKNTKTFLAIHNDQIICEEYTQGWDKDKKHFTASAAKAVVGGLALMIAISDGLIGIDDLACKFIPQWKNHPMKSKITVRHLASHTSGLDDANTQGVSHKELPGWKGAFWRQEPDLFNLVKDEVPVVFAPGTDYLYSNPGIAMMDYVIATSLKGMLVEDIRTLLWERLMKPMGILEDEWSIGYEKIFIQDGLNLVPSWGGCNITARALAKIGRLLIHKGNWDGTQLIDSKVVKNALKHSGTPSYHSFGFWVNSDLAGNKRWPSLPWDTVMALGAQDQILLISPRYKLIVVRNGGALVQEEGGMHYENRLDQYIGTPLMAAMNDPVPYPKSTKIPNIEWAPASTIIRLSTGEDKRDGSDNWPVTWTDDDNLYTAYGDGYGFEPSLPYKLGMGFARIKGAFDNFTCENIRSNGENTAYGGKGKKASGLLMVDHVLYLWVRNDNLNGEYARLACSKDYAKTWEWCDWRFEDFGHIAFINYGRNYEGARDEYIYMVTHDNPSAYKVADSFVLIRVHKEHPLDRNLYEFYQGMDQNNQPLWVSEVKNRGAVFTNPQNCRRSSISYNAGIGRYLWWQQYSSTGDVDTRFIGGLGIYEAPEPWGPWSTVYFTEKWDVGAGDLGCFPTKWMSEDGKTVNLIFAGNDNFSLRKATLTVAE